MRRTELIPQTSAAINSGKVYYHFSISRSDNNAPSEYREHQICFFESHFTEMRSGWQSGESGTSDSMLRWDVNSETQWNVTWEAGVWYNVAYGIDFDASSVQFYHSTGSDDLVLTVSQQLVYLPPQTELTGTWEFLSFLGLVMPTRMRTFFSVASILRVVT